ncbi:MAG TPA: sugar ABC transporter substrate-binding protein [Methanomassiliicoccales archaeon]|nr:sugar ABC transporter substrate-binding protein [Methanomassiliicoccales archaeon]
MIKAKSMLTATLALFVVGAGVLVVGHAKAASKPVVIGISTDAGYPARGIEVIGIYEKAKSNPNVKVIEQNADNDSSKQIQQVKSMVDQGATAIVVCAVDMNAIKTALDYANQKHVIVTLYDRFVDHPAVKFVGGYDSYKDGLKSGEAIKGFNDGKPHVVFELVGNLADTNALARRDGFHKVIDGEKNLKVVQIQTDWSTDKALAGMENSLQKYPDVWAIFNASSHMDGSITTALKEAGRLKKRGEPGHVILVSLGGEPPGMQTALDGYTDVFMVIPFDEMGAQIYDAIMKLANNESLSSNKYYCKTFPVMGSEVEKRKEEIFAWRYRDLLNK